VVHLGNGAAEGCFEVDAAEGCFEVDGVDLDDGEHSQIGR
jgi:hypothetical protein